MMNENGGRRWRGLHLRLTSSSRSSQERETKVEGSVIYARREARINFWYWNNKDSEV